jgi:hypothetical protein
LTVLLVLSVSLLLIPTVYHLIQVGLPVQGALHVFGSRGLLIHLFFILAITGLLAIVRKRN